MKWKLIKNAIYLVGAYKLLGFKFIRKYILSFLLFKGRSFLPI